MVTYKGTQIKRVVIKQQDKLKMAWRANGVVGSAREVANAVGKNTIDKNIVYTLLLKSTN